MKKLIAATALLCIVGTAQAKAVYYETITDSFSKREIEYFDLDGQNTVRLYFTQNFWLKDSDAFVVGGENDKRLYKYDINSHTTQTLNGGQTANTIDFAVTNDNKMYFLNNSDKKIYCEDLENGGIEYVTDYPASSISMIHSTADGKFFTVTGGGMPVYDVENQTWDKRYKKSFPAPYTIANHVMINPVYENLTLFAHEGTTTDIFDRIWRLDRNTGEFKNIFRQYRNIENINTGETTGHESWTPDGESVVTVKYTYPKNVGKSGIVRMNKDGGEREYLNSDYRHWHCSASSDGRWIVSDVIYQSSGKNIIADIVMTDSKTGDAYVIARQKAGPNHPWQPHPQFSPDGKKVTFSMTVRQSDGNDILGVGMVDVSDLVSDGQVKDKVYARTNEQDSFRVTPITIYKDGAEKNVLSMGVNTIKTQAEIFGQKNLTLYAAAYDRDGKLISIGSGETDTSGEMCADVNISADCRLLKCFVWDANEKPALFSDTAPEKLRVAKKNKNGVVLSWQPSNNLTDIGYEIFRNGVKIAETEDCIYRDMTLDANTEYLYEVKPIHQKGLTAAGSSCVEIPVETAYSDLKSTTVNDGLEFLDNDTNIASDSFTLHENIGGRDCRRAKTFRKDEEYNGTVCTGRDRTGMFYFKADRNMISSDDLNVTVGVSYYDNGNIPIYLQYNAADGSVGKNVKIADRTGSNTWKTAEISVDDAKFCAPQALTGCDFRIVGGADTYIDRVWAYPEREELLSDKAYSALGGATVNSGLEFLDNDTNIASDSFTLHANIGGEACRKAIHAAKGTEYNWTVCTGRDRDGMFYFKCDRSIVSSDERNVTIKIRYFDNSENPIYVKYNAADGSVGKSVKLTDRKGSNSWKIAEISVDDAKFVAPQALSYCDFRVEGGADTYISKVWAYPSEGSDMTFASGVKAKTAASYASADLGETVSEDGLGFVLNDSNKTSDSYTEAAEIGGEACRVNTLQRVETDSGVKNKVGMFYFKADRRIINENDRNVVITVRYYDSGTGEVSLQYNAADGSIAKKIVLAKKANSNTWKEASAELTDAKFVAPQALTYSDFRVVADAGTYISRVSAENKTGISDSGKQYVLWTPESNSGLSLTSGSSDGSLTAAAPIGFDVENEYMQGADANMAWIDITYEDTAAGNICIDYNTSDPTATEEQKPAKRAEDVIECTGSGKVITKRIALIDVSFEGLGGCDFKLVSDCGISIKSVRVIGY